MVGMGVSIRLAIALNFIRIDLVSLPPWESEGLLDLSEYVEPECDDCAECF